MKRLLLAILLALAPLPSALAQDAVSTPPAIALSGEGISAVSLTPETLAAYPTITLDVSFETSKGRQGGSYTGVPLWAVLERAGLLDSAGHHDELRRTFEVRGRDGYAILFSVGEVAPDFGNTTLLLALQIDGKPLPPADGIRLIVPGDTKGARNVRDVASITVR